MKASNLASISEYIAADFKYSNCSPSLISKMTNFVAEQIKLAIVAELASQIKQGKLGDLKQDYKTILQIKGFGSLRVKYNRANKGIYIIFKDYVSKQKAKNHD
jgi:hypothetical protein